MAVLIDAYPEPVIGPVPEDKYFDSLVASIIGQQLSVKAAATIEGRVRNLARVLPYGLETPLLVGELLPGESDLPTRLRIEAEAADAERQAVRARIELAAAISAWRQALGLLPQ